MPEHETFDAHHKALSLNLDLTIFGSFAEIGAGQEVARWFLQVGGASGMVAKTISAYDKEVSDHIYGTGTRYVSKQRLKAMLDHEWSQLLTQLQLTRGATTKFFAFVDTISARNYAGTNDSHGWIGLRFLQQPSGPPSDLILHINLRDPSNVQQQEAVGLLGVNLIWAAYHSMASPQEFLASISEELGMDRIEIDLLEFSGPAFSTWNEKEVHAFLAVGGYAEAVVFTADNRLAPANELLYKRALVLAPGRFVYAGTLHANLIEDTLAQLPADELQESKGGLGLFCLAIPPDSPTRPKDAVKDILDRVLGLQKLGYGVALFRAQQLYTMSTFVNRYTKSRIHFAIGLTVLVRFFEDSYKELPGALIEGTARLFTQNVRLSVYPMTIEELQRRAEAAELTGWTWKETDGIVTADNMHPSGAVDHLYQYLLASQYLLVGKPQKAPVTQA